MGRPCGVGLSSCRTLEPESNEKVDAAAECCDAATLRPALPVAPLLPSSWQWAGLGDGLGAATAASSKEIAEQGVVALPAVLAELVLKALIAESVAWSSSRGEGVSRTASSSCSASIAFCSRLV